MVLQPWQTQSEESVQMMTLYHTCPLATYPVKLRKQWLYVPSREVCISCLFSFGLYAVSSLVVCTHLTLTFYVYTE